MRMQHKVGRHKPETGEKRAPPTGPWSLPLGNPVSGHLREVVRAYTFMEVCTHVHFYIIMLTLHAFCIVHTSRHLVSTLHSVTGRS